MSIEHKRAKILRMPGANGLPISQTDLAEFELLRQRAVDAVAALDAKRRAIRKAIESGRHIEPGLRSARIERVKRLIVR
jgi:hypothetical protein